MGLHVDVSVRSRRPMPTRVLARLATTGIYLVASPATCSGARVSAPCARGPRSAGCSCKACASMRRETWTPQPDDNSPESAHDPCD
jgi:hypothetical protein